METFSWRDTLKTNIVVLRFLGLWPRANTTYTFDSYTIYATLLLTCLLTAHTVFQVINIFFVYSNLQGLTETIFITVTEVLTLVKIYYFLKNRSTLTHLMLTLKTEQFQPKNPKLVESDLVFWKRISMVLVVTVGSCLTFWCSFPLLDTSDAEIRLPFASWYPFDTQESPGYELTYLHQVVSIVCLAAANLNLDTLISALMMLIGAQCDILCENLRHIKADVFGTELIKCMTHHKEIVKFSENCNDFFSMIALGQFFTSVACIAVTLFRLTMVSPLSSEFSSLFFYLGAAIQEIFLYCWFGNEVVVKSGQIVYAAFESQWAKAPIADKKNLLIFLLRCQRPIKMSAFRLVYLTLETYVSILRVSWSYFAVLQNINAPE